MTFREWVPTVLILLLVPVAAILVVVGMTMNNIVLFCVGLACWALFLILLMHG